MPTATAQDFSKHMVGCKMSTPGSGLALGGGDEGLDGPWDPAGVACVTFAPWEGLVPMLPLASEVRLLGLSPCFMVF